MRLVVVVVALMVAFALPFRPAGPAGPARPPDSEPRVAGADDPIARLNERILSGAATLPYEPSYGYLRPLLDALRIPIESQLLVFLPTSRQRDHISFRRPRAIYFNDAAAVAFVNGGELEVIAQEPGAGLVFYTLEQRPQERPQLMRGRDCMQCHLLPDTGGAGGLQLTSVLPIADGPGHVARGWPVDDRTPFADRWGGWYVTGSAVPAVHLGNVPVQHVPLSDARAATAPRLTSTDGRLNRQIVPASASDVVALLALGHQVRTLNLMIELWWRTREAAGASGRASQPVERLVRDLADALLFTGAAPLPSPVRGSSAFATQFAARGPRDPRGRSFRDLDLESRFLRYGFSYLIYSETFAAIPEETRARVYQRLWQVLSGADSSEAYRQLSPTTRGAIVDILRQTKSEASGYFK